MHNPIITDNIENTAQNMTINRRNNLCHGHATGQMGGSAQTNYFLTLQTNLAQ